MQHPHALPSSAASLSPGQLVALESASEARETWKGGMEAEQRKCLERYCDVLRVLASMGKSIVCDGARTPQPLLYMLFEREFGEGASSADIPQGWVCRWSLQDMANAVLPAEPYTIHYVFLCLLGVTPLDPSLCVQVNKTRDDQVSPNPCHFAVCWPFFTPKDALESAQQCRFAA